MRTCSDLSKNIYLWNEINEDERSALQLHMNECSACKQMFDEVQALLQLTEKVAKQKGEVPHAARLTSMIMDRIHAQKPVVRFSIKQWWQHNFLRLASFSFSLVILLSFGIEYFKNNQPVEIIKPPALQMSILDSRSFRKKIISASINKERNEDCNPVFLTGPAYLQCLRKNLKPQ